MITNKTEIISKESTMETRKRSTAAQKTSEDEEIDVTGDSGFDGGASGDGHDISGNHSAANTSHKTGVFGNFLSPPKKQKVDGDVFLKPATPDIPLQSVHRDHKVRTSDSGDILTDDNNTSLPESGYVLPEHSQVESQLTDLHSVTAADKQEPRPLAELIKYFSSETEELCQQFTQGFSDMENYEVFCVTRLQKLLDDARNLELSLLRQREQLRQRVQQLSQTLRLP